MKTLNIEYSNNIKLIEFMDRHNLVAYENILIQLFTTMVERHYIQNLIHTLKVHLPHAKIIGATSDGNILDDQVSKGTILSFSLFEDTKIETYIATNQGDCYSLGVELANQFQDIDNLKATIAFSDGTHTNGEEFLLGMNSKTQNILSGGMASDNGEFKQTFVFNENKIIDHGGVCAVLYGKRLIVNRMHNFGWQPIGKKLVVTKSEKNRVYEIDGMSAVDTYKKYLGDTIEQLLPKTGVEFPLVLEKDNLRIARAVLQKHEDGSLSFAGNIEEGQAVQFGFGDINHILNEKDKNFELALTYPIESIFIYSCMARRRLLDGFVSQEIRPYNKLAPTAGFFSNGEFYCCRYSQEYNLLNQSKTILFLSESDDISKRVKLDKIEQDSQTHRIEALTHLIKETSQELSDLNGRLNERVLEGIEKFKAIFDATQSIIFVIKDKRFYEANQSFMKFFDFLYPSTIERVECDLCHHFENYKPKNNYITKPYINGHYWLDYVIEHQDIQHKVAIKKVDQLYHFVVNVQKISNAKYVVELTDITKDITFQQEVKQKNKMLIQQSKMAQMGELLTMISHQWRQPLSAVASININLLIKNQMDVLDKSYLDEKLLEGDQYIKFLNQTIDDFKQFFRSDIDKKETSFYQIIQNVNNIVEQSLIHHNITLHIDLDEEGLSFKTYENDLQQVGLNIISNAKDAIAESGVADGQIVVRSHAENNYCVLEISNNGGNIPKELKEKIFNPYFTTKPHKHGTGIGLYISKMIMDKLDSTIECQNREGGWCSFILKIKR